MKIKDSETGEERECCDPVTDFVICKAPNVGELKKKYKKKKLFECVHCGRKWKFGHGGIGKCWKALPEGV